ncbi:hypothetical protein GW17_00059737 [Ensete ventricosum]|nr:hypothetical protein GW17_00059737 [Ensete ventricosum]
MAGACGRMQRPRPGRSQPGHKGQLPVARPQGAAPRPRRRPLVGTAASRGSARARWRRPPARCRPRAPALPAKVAAHVDGVQPRRLRRAATAREGKG